MLRSTYLLEKRWSKEVRAFAALSLFAGIFTTAAVPLQAQQTRNLYVAVSDPLNRFVTGLELEHFAVAEKGVPLPITAIANADSPITIAVVSDEQLQPSAAAMGPKDVLIQTSSLADALKQLSASTSPRKSLVVTTSLQVPTIAEHIQVVRVDPSMLTRALVELRNQYLLKVNADQPTSGLEVVVKAPRGLPVLQAHQWKPGPSK